MKKKIAVFVPVFLAFILFICSFVPLITTGESISNKVLRLHIIANSDSDYDQNVKLKVRDEVLKLSGDMFADCKTLEDAKNVSQNNIDLIQSIANNTLSSLGCSEAATVAVAKEYFSTRIYDDFTLPAGIYDSIKIVIGNGEGHNWWCVMFPQVCLSGCTKDLEDDLTDEEIKMIHSKDYIVKFKAVEIYEKLKYKIYS
ncbi:MAG: stage II sporulation protein R [Oscillospiraceae bacterium]|nr:stage II sporulation protein R [Oscillospiraceae bacterium]